MADGPPWRSELCGIQKKIRAPKSTITKWEGGKKRLALLNSVSDLMTKRHFEILKEKAVCVCEEALVAFM